MAIFNGKRKINECVKKKKYGHYGLYLALSAIDFVHWHLYNSYFAFGAHWNFPSTDARP